MGESILNREGMEKYKGYSAGSQLKGEIFPAVHTFLEYYNYQTNGLRLMIRQRLKSAWS